MDLKACIHVAGSIFYEQALSQHAKRAAMQVFLAMDTDGDGSVSLRELMATAARTWHGSLLSMFQLLDVDNSGSLDFEECKALFFLALCSEFCDGCGAVVLDSVYSCTACLTQRNVHFDLCCDCYPTALRSHAAHHRSTFQRQNLIVADVIEAVATCARETSTATTNVSTITHNNYYIYNNNNNRPHGGNSNNAITPYTPPPRTNGRINTIIERLSQSLSLATSVGTILSSCSIM